MLKKPLLFLFSLLAFSIFGIEVKETRRKEILSLLEKEIRVVKRLVNSAPVDKQKHLVRRLFTLYSEKMKLIRAEENEAFLKSDDEDADEYFQKSREIYQRSFTEAMKILEGNPNFKDVGRFYYILALNDRDFFDGKQEIDFYYEALDNTDDQGLINEIKSSLADSFYNKKNLRLVKIGGCKYTANYLNDKHKSNAVFTC